MWINPCLLAIMACVAPFIAYAQDLRQEQLRALYLKSGMEKQIKQLPSLVEAGFDQTLMESTDARKLPKNILSAIREAIPHAFAPERMKELMLLRLSERLSDEDVRSVLAWLNSSIGTKCTLLEETASTPEALVEMQNFAAQVQNAPPPKERVDILKDLDDAVRATEASAAVALNMQVAVAAAILASLPGEGHRSLDDLLSEAERARPAIEAAIGPQTLMSFLYTYRTLTISELQTYIQFARSPEGVKYHTASSSGLKSIFVEGAITLGKAIAAAVGGAKGKTEL